MEYIIKYCSDISNLLLVNKELLRFIDKQILQKESEYLKNIEEISRNLNFDYSIRYNQYIQKRKYWNFLKRKTSKEPISEEIFNISVRISEVTKASKWFFCGFFKICEFYKIDKKIIKFHYKSFTPSKVLSDSANVEFALDFGISYYDAKNIKNIHQIVERFAKANFSHGNIKFCRLKSWLKFPKTMKFLKFSNVEKMELEKNFFHLSKIPFKEIKSLKELTIVHGENSKDLDYGFLKSESLKILKIRNFREKISLNGLSERLPNLEILDLTNVDERILKESILYGKANEYESFLGSYKYQKLEEIDSYKINSYYALVRGNTFRKLSPIEGFVVNEFSHKKLNKISFEINTKSFEKDKDKIPLVFKESKILKTLILSGNLKETITRVDIVFYKKMYLKNLKERGIVAQVLEK